MLTNICLRNLLSSDIVLVFISSFLAFCSALVVEYIVAQTKKRKSIKELKAKLSDELDRIYSISNSLEAGKLYLYPYPTPVFSGACMSGSIMCLSGETYFSDLVQVFSSIQEANNIETKCFELASMNSSFQINEINEILIESRSGIKNCLVNRSNMLISK